MINYNKEIDKENIKIFELWGIRQAQEKRHKCVICKKRTCIDYSYSNNGHKLICTNCFYAMFDCNIEKLTEWQSEEDD